MKPSVLIALVALAVAAGSFALTLWTRPAPADDEMTWLRQEFALTPAQVASIEKMRAAYQPICEEHCRAISETRAKLTALEKAGRKDSPEYKTAETAWEALCRTCQDATQRHLESIAAQMSAEQGARYRQLIGPKLSRQDHRQPLGLK